MTPITSQAGRKAGVGPRRDTRRRGPTRDGLTMGVLVAPSILLLLLINAYPLATAASQSVHNGTLITTGEFIGLANYVDVLTGPRFAKAVGFTLIFTLCGVFGSWLIGLGLALLLRTQLPGSNFFKVLLMLPWVIPVVVSSSAVRWLVGTQDSPLPLLASWLGLGDIYFLAEDVPAAIMVCLFKIWCSFSFMMLMSSSALAAIDPNVYEAAGVDGASKGQQLRYLTLPLIARSTYISWILMAIFCVNDFPTIYLLTAGGPIDATTSLVVLAYRTVFQDLQTGPGVAIAFMMTMALVIVSVVLYGRIRKVEIE